MIFPFLRLLKGTCNDHIQKKTALIKPSSICDSWNPLSFKDSGYFYFLMEQLRKRERLEMRMPCFCFSEGIRMIAAPAKLR